MRVGCRKIAIQATSKPLLENNLPATYIPHAHAAITRKGQQQRLLEELFIWCAIHIDLGLSIDIKNVCLDISKVKEVG